MTQPTRDPKWKHERLTSPAKGFAPFLAPLGARGGAQKHMFYKHATHMARKRILGALNNG